MLTDPSVPSILVRDFPPSLACFPQPLDRLKGERRYSKSSHGRVLLEQKDNCIERSRCETLVVIGRTQVQKAADRSTAGSRWIVGKSTPTPMDVQQGSSTSIPQLLGLVCLECLEPSSAVLRHRLHLFTYRQQLLLRSSCSHVRSEREPESRIE